MKIKIGDQFYDSADQPIMVVLSSTEKRQIASMGPEATQYCAYDEGSYSDREIEAWMLEN